MLDGTGTVMVASSLSLLGSSSNWSSAVIVAVLVIAPGSVTSAVIVSVAVPLTSRSPTVHTPLVLS